MDIGFTETDWQRIEQDYTAWWKEDLDRPLLYLGLPRPGAVCDVNTFMPNWPLDQTDDELVETVLRVTCSQDYAADAYPFFCPNYGPGVAAAFTGATLHSTPHTVWFEHPEQHGLSDIRICLDSEDPWWRRLRHVTRVLAERLGDRVAIAFTDIGGNLDILASLRGTQDLLIDCATSPDEVGRLTREITRLWMAVYDELHALMEPHCHGTTAWSRIWAPGRTYIFQSDFAYMLGPNMFKEFVAPDIETCCETIEYGFYHLDGAGQIPHLDHLCGIDALRGIQWVSGAGAKPASEWPDVIGRIREAGKLCQISATPDQVLSVIRRHGGKGFHFDVMAEGLTAGNLKAFLADARA